MRIQFNTRIQAAIKRRVDNECRSRIPTKDIVVEVALENWFSKYTPEQRAKFYSAHDRKPYAKAA